MKNYLTGIPKEVEKYGLCKTFYTRKESIHIKHILTEIFVRKKIEINHLLSYIEYDIFKYMGYITNRLRNIYKIDRGYKKDVNNIIKEGRDSFFKLLDLYDGLNNLVILDFDGVITDDFFIKNFYNRIIQRNVFICSANPNINDSFFEERKIKLPRKIISCKGKKKKIRAIVEISKKYDNVFYIDNEEEYLKYAWIFGINTFLYSKSKINYFTLNTK